MIERIMTLDASIGSNQTNIVWFLFLDLGKLQSPHDLAQKKMLELAHSITNGRFHLLHE